MSDGPPPLTREDVEQGLSFARALSRTASSPALEGIRLGALRALDYVEAEYHRLTTLEKDWDEYWRGTTFAEHVAIQKARPTPPENTI